ncbi:MAG: thiamine phosphate synthase [Lachnospiraceae bacterium]
MKKQDLLLYAITDRNWLKPGETLSEQVEKAILGKATIIQLREKHLTGDRLEQLALEVFAVCKKYNIPFIINDDVELAAKIGADGVHVGQSDMSVGDARKLLGHNAIIGATAKTVEQAVAAQAAGADYLGSGAVFGTDTKADARPMDLSLFTEICNSVTIPVVAIGGITADNVEKLAGTPMAGVAVVSAVFAAEDITAATNNLYNKLTTLVKE